MRLDELKEGVFIAGTDTGVGKTVVAGLAARAAVEGGRRVAVMKPVASGGRRRGAACVSADAEFLLAACRREIPMAQVNPFCFEAALAPPLAAALEGRAISWEGILEAYGLLRRQADFLVVEGAGGVFSPVAQGRTCLDLAQVLKLPLWVVVPCRIGMIHQAASALLAARAGGRPAAGFVASGIASDHPHWEWDVHEITRQTDVPCVGRVPRLSGEVVDPASRAFPSGPLLRSYFS